MNDIETATTATGREGRPFPPEWGKPPADYEQRAGWIKAKIRCGEIAREFGEEVRWLGSSSRVTVPSYVVARRVAQMRLRLVEVIARSQQ
jgi:hypothetical protein